MIKFSGSYWLVKKILSTAKVIQSVKEALADRNRLVFPKISHQLTIRDRPTTSRINVDQGENDGVTRGWLTKSDVVVRSGTDKPEIYSF